MIKDLRELKAGILLSAREQLRYLVNAKTPDTLSYQAPEKHTIEKGEIVMYLGFVVEKSFQFEGNYSSIKIKLLIQDRVHWVTICSITENTNTLPTDIFDSNFALPYFDTAKK